MKETEMQQLLTKTQAYLYYIDGHYLSVQEAWKLVQEKCKDMRFVYDDFVFHVLNQHVINHDVSKLSAEEFVPYRKKFFPTDTEAQNEDPNKINVEFQKAWEHHKAYNPHHWENWTKQEMVSNPYELEVHCVHMVIDWIAMGMHFNNTAKSYYEDNKHKIDLPDWAGKFIYEIFDKVYSDE